MGTERKASVILARRVLAKPLFQAIEHLFGQNLSGCVLVGGTALSGFYFSHRRSDDIDIFTRDASAQMSAVLAVKSLVSLGASFQDEFHTAPYYRTTCRIGGYFFTVDLVQDPNFFRVGSFQKVGKNIQVADISTLLKTKSAALVSRCSEKDLYDLLFILRESEGTGVRDIVEQGREIDAGVNGESLLLSVSGVTLRESACDFSLDPKITKRQIHKRLVRFQKELVRRLTLYLKKLPAPPLRDLIVKLMRLR